MSLGTHPSIGFTLWPCTYLQPFYKMDKWMPQQVSHLRVKVLMKAGKRFQMGGQHTAESPSLCRLLETFPAILKTLGSFKSRFI